MGMLAAGLLSAGIAFIGVVLQNISASRRHLRDLEHDANQRKLEREAELRKLIYLDAVENLTMLSAKVLGLVSIKQTDQKDDDLARRLGLITRLYAIAEIETVRLVERATRAIVNAAFYIARLNMAIMAFERKVDELKRLFELAVEQRDNRSKQLAASGLGSEDQQKLIAERDQFQERVVNLAEDLEKRLSQLLAHKVDLFSATASKSNDVNPHVWRAVIAIRRELGFPIDEGEFLALASESSGEIMRAAEKFFTEIKNDLEAKSKQKPISTA